MSCPISELTVFRQDQTLLGGSVSNLDKTFRDGFLHGKNDKEAFRKLFWSLGCLKMHEAQNNGKNQIFWGF